MAVKADRHVEFVVGLFNALNLHRSIRMIFLSTHDRPTNSHRLMPTTI